jgi:hypothetical protein
VSTPAFSSRGMLDSAVLDSAALGSCFLTGVGWEVRAAFTCAACFTFSVGVLSAGPSSFDEKHGRQESKPPPDLLDLLRVEPSRCAAADADAGWPGFSDMATRLLLVVLPSRLRIKLRFECFDARPMLSESAAVTPLSPVPVGVCSSFEFDCAPDWGTPRSDCFCFESASALRWDDERSGTAVLLGPTWIC